MADNMTECGHVTDASVQEARRRQPVMTTLLAMRAKHRNEEGLLRVVLEQQEALSRAYEDAMCATSFAMAAIVSELSPIQRERWAFQRNERWFEETLPHLGDAHFRQALCVTPATFSYIVNALKCELERCDSNMRQTTCIASPEHNLAQKHTLPREQQQRQWPTSSRCG
ncbi:hypothetical protein HPB50_028081 [Hyalomma asiaticum]|nr:hypothetical protein HPB50_028081 [Hyalomma asiaticum]